MNNEIKGKDITNNELSFKEKIIASNKIYIRCMVFGFISMVLIFVFAILAAILDPYWYSKPTFIDYFIYWLLIILAITSLLSCITLIIIFYILGNMRMKIVREFATKYPNDEKIKFINNTYNTLFQSDKRQRELTCYVMEELYPEINTRKDISDISSRL